MELSFVSVILISLVGYGSGSEQDPCFTFDGNGYLRFNIDNFVNNDDAHYSMKFSTTGLHGLLLYSRGGHDDEEALYIRDGRLTYSLFNPAPTGVEGFFGGFFRGDQIVSTGETVTVHVYRSYNVNDRSQRRTRQQTGLIYSIGGRTYTHVDFRPRSNIVLRPNIFIGGYLESLSSTVGNFTGQISGIREEKNAALFNNFSFNSGSVQLTCLTNFRPV